jgi:hypothetical protein
MSGSGDWPALLDVIHDALAHALNGRLAGLDGIVQLARIRGGLDAELMALLEDEVRRLGDAANAAAHVPRNGRDLGTVTTLRDAVVAAVDVNRIRRDVSILVLPAPGSAAVRAPHDELVRCILLLVHLLEPRAAGSGAAIEVTEMSTSERAVLRFRIASGGGSGRHESAGEAAVLAGKLGGAVEVGADGDLELSLPRLDTELEG